MVNGGIDAVFTQPLVRHLRPAGTRSLKVFGSFAPGLLRIQLCAQTIRFHLTGGSQDVSMVVSAVALFAWSVNRHIDRAPFAVGHVLGEVNGQPPPLSRRKLGRQRHLKLTRHASILALLSQFCSIP